MAATLTARLADDGIPTLDDVLRNADNSFFVEKESALHQVAMVENEKKKSELMVILAHSVGWLNSLSGFSH